MYIDYCMYIFPFVVCFSFNFLIDFEEMCIFRFLFTTVCRGKKIFQQKYHKQMLEKLGEDS